MYIAMSKMSRVEDSTSKTVSIPSSYFQTEFTTRKSDCSSGDEISAISKILNNLPIDGKLETRRNLSLGYKSKKVSISVQTGRSIIGQEDSLPKERKRWIRPPGVGQASTSSHENVVLPVSNIKEYSSEDEIKPQTCPKRPASLEYGSAADIYPNRKEYINEKPMEGSSDQSLPQLSDQNDLPRVISPSSASSITSRPLEWDSGADVGYFQNYGSVSRSDQEFSSTMERIALVQGRTGMLTRSDPEGTSSSKKGNPAVSAIGLPTAESTPINSNSLEGNSSKEKMSVKSMVGKQKHHPLFPEVIIQHRGNISDSSNECDSTQKDIFDGSVKDSKLKKLSSSLENVNEIKSVKGQSATFPRSQSQSNLNSEVEYNSHLQRILNPPQSVSSSSVATVITGIARKSSKCIQTSYFRNNIGVQSSLNGSLIQKPEENKPKRNGYGTLDSAPLSSDDRVNSFEYLPGHVYENANKTNGHDFWENTKGVSLKNDVERGVQIIEEFIQGSNANNTLKKKELLHRVVEKLIETDYPEDVGLFKMAPQCSTRSQNREEVIGESSSEASQVAGNKVLSNSTNLSDQSSSVSQTTSESMKSSEKSIQGVVSKSQAGSGSSKRGDKQVVKDRSTDLSSESRSDWKEPLTRAEKLYELKKKGFKKGDDQLLDFINSERENQIDWIVKEINHLSNLKTLLEKHERLRKNLNRLKTAKSKSDSSPSKHSFVRPGGFKRRSQYVPPGNKSTENIYLKRRQNLGIINEDRGWDSHNYETDNAGRLKRNASTETRREDLARGAKSVAYTITFDPDIKPQKSSRPEVRPLIADRQTLEKESRTRVREAFRNPSLQDCLINKRPDVVTRAEVRRQTLAELAAIRQVREEKRPAVLAAALNCETATTGVPPVSLVKRVVSQKEMREQTERRYRKTFEIKKKVSDQKLKETRKSNRLMADLFNKRLQLLTLKGHTNLSNSIDVISTV